jgi:hypothetical protein
MGGIKKILDDVVDFIDSKVNIAIDKLNLTKVNILTFENAVNYYYDMKKKFPEIKKCVIYIERVGGEFKFRIEQLFKDANDEILYSDNEKKDLYGRVVQASNLDDELGKFIKGKDKVMVVL